MSRLRHADGSTAVEFALVLPLLLALIALVVTVAAGMAVRGLLHRGTEAGARAAAIVAEPARRTAERYRSEDEIVASVREGTVLLDATAVDVDWLDGHDGEGARFAVTATYTWSNPIARLVAPLSGATATDSELIFSARTERVRE